MCTCARIIISFTMATLMVVPPHLSNAVHVHDLLFNVNSIVVGDVRNVMGNIGPGGEVVGDVRNITGNVRGKVRGSLQNITGNIYEGAVIEGNVGNVQGNVAGRVSGNISTVTGNIQAGAHVGGTVRRIVGNVDGFVGGKIDRIVGRVGPNASIDGKSGDELQQIYGHRNGSESSSFIGSFMNLGGGSIIYDTQGVNVHQNSYNGRTHTKLNSNSADIQNSQISYQAGCTAELLVRRGLSAQCAVDSIFENATGIHSWAYKNPEGHVACGVIQVYGNGHCSWLEGSDPSEFVRQWYHSDCSEGVTLADGHTVHIANGHTVFSFYGHGYSINTGGSIRINNNNSCPTM